MDRTISKGVFVFDTLGRFKYSVKASGKGPKEFITHYSFCIDDQHKELLIFDGRLSKIISYDLKTGRPLSEKHVNFRFSNFLRLPNGDFAMSIHAGNNAHLPDINHYQLIITDSAFQIKKHFLQDQFSDNNLFSRTDLTQNLSVHYAPRYTNSIYSISSSGIHEKYHLQYDGVEVNSDAYLLETKDLLAQVEKSGTYYFQSKFIEGSAVDYFEIRGHRKRIYAFYDKTTGAIMGGETMTFDPLVLPFYSNPVAGYQDELISYLSVNTLLNLKESNSDELIKSLPEHYQSTLAQINLYSNPVIMKFKVSLDP